MSCQLDERRISKSIVPIEGLEPPRLSAPDPKSGVSTNSTIQALVEPTGIEPVWVDFQSTALTNLARVPYIAKKNTPGKLREPGVFYP